MENFVQVTPCLHLRDLKEAVQFFTEMLDFSFVSARMTTPTFIARLSTSRLMTRCEEDGSMPERSGSTYYVDNRSMDDLLTELKPKLDALPPGSVHGPLNESHGQRERIIRAPDQHLLVFGQAISC